jgi:tetraacyldisaccharide-1-P 4'-kinase
MNSDLTFILDDGFQHLQLERDLDLLVVDCSQSLADNSLFPGGSLREPLAGMSRAQAIIMNLSAAGASSERLVPTVRKFNRSAPLLHCRQVIEYVIPFACWSECSAASEERLREGDAFLVAAIGNPERFRRDVEDLGIHVRG